MARPMQYLHVIISPSPHARQVWKDPSRYGYVGGHFIAVIMRLRMVELSSLD